MQIADRVRRLHGRNHAELRESRNVHGADDLRVLDSPARLANLALFGRHRLHRFFVPIENRSIRSIAYRVSLNLNPFSQSFLEHRHDDFFLLSEKPRGVVV